MTCIWTDANILLGFWKLREGRLQSELLPALVELRDHILVTRQLVDETVRNRLNVFMESAKFTKAPQPPAIPDHLMATEAARTWNARHQSVMEGRKVLDRDWQTILTGLANAIAAGQDPVSKALEPLFANVRNHGNEQLSRARDRRERGNPPGKKGDPLGDQLSWEQFLDDVRDQRSVWIITRDSDYATRLSAERVVLNPLLGNDLLQLGVRDFRVFDDLADAIKDIKASGLNVTRAPPDERLDQLSKVLKPSAPTYELLYPGPPTVCPACESKNSFSSLAPHPSRFGGWTYQATCRMCGFNWDGGEPYDD